PQSYPCTLSSYSRARRRGHPPPSLAAARREREPASTSKTRSPAMSQQSLKSTKSTKSRTLTALIAAALALPFAAEAHAEWPEEHLDTVDFFFSEFTPANNEYDEPSKIEVIDGKLVIKAVCGGFVAQLLKLAYPDAVTSSLLKSMTGMTN